MASDKDTLLSMGFDSSRVEWALKATNNRGLQPAMDHLLQHENDPIPDLTSLNPSIPNPTSSDPTDEDEEDVDALNSLGVATAGAIEAKSIKCSECGKIFKNTALANFHAEKSGHDQFEESTEEIKPLTESEKAQKLADLRDKLAQKRRLRASEEAKEHQANEVLRRKAGKDLNKLKEDIKIKQAEKEAEAKKREKIEDAKARAAIKAQIEADKKARAEKAAREKALRDGQPVPATLSSSSSSLSTTTTTTTTTTGPSREFKETRLQIRMASGGGQPYTTTLPSDAPLREVAEFLAAQTLSVDVETVTFTQSFPRKTFSQSDFSKSLKELGLTPSAVLIASTPT
ncbi:hypothetical protein AMATHDRAFT_69297 [Amanita thiersii Skay4041]|uniref:UBX domain-containing protein n=1 Tax=Amanita thiersii Skay4041 TaxID=703135 RepID=A0A2A9N9I1_9AGAR|nr:hypothetical protein AMATHDRAFT_69297 [Amanita thiersii Skay4041]